MKARRKTKKLPKAAMLSPAGQALVNAAHRGVDFVTKHAQDYPHPEVDAMFVLEQILRFAHSLEGANGEQGIPMVAGMAVRAAWQYGRTQQMPDIRVESDMVPMILSTLKDIPDDCILTIQDVSAAVFATLRMQAINGENAARRNSIRLALCVIYTYGKRSMAKETAI